MQYPSLYNIAWKKQATVSSVFDRVPLNVTFRRLLQGQNLILWYELVNKIANVQLNDNKDRFRWNITSNGLFTVQSMYRSLLNNNAISGHRVIWQIKVPLKIKVFLWYLSKGVTLTKDNLAKRNWNGSKLCSFCGHNETIQHLFFDCQYARFLWRMVFCCFNIKPPNNINHLLGSWVYGMDNKVKKQMLVGASALCWAIWLSRNDMVFNKVSSKTYLQVLYRGTYWLHFWAQLQKCEEDKEEIRKACRHLEVMALQIFAHHE